jgi:hypothetical protein
VRPRIDLDDTATLLDRMEERHPPFHSATCTIAFTTPPP